MASKPELIASHHRLLSGDWTAHSGLTHLVLGPLRVALRCRDGDLRADAAVDAIVDYLYHPWKFDPANRSLTGYLQMAASANSKNALRARERRTRHETAAGQSAGKSVELPSPPGNDLEPAEASAASATPPLTCWTA